METGQTFMRGLHTGSSESYRIHCCESQSKVLTMHVDVSRAYFHAKAQRHVAGEIASRRLLRKGRGKIGLLTKNT